MVLLLVCSWPSWCWLWQTLPSGSVVSPDQSEYPRQEEKRGAYKPQKQAGCKTFSQRATAEGNAAELWGSDTFTNQVAKDSALRRVGNKSPCVYWVCSRGRSAVDKTGPITSSEKGHDLLLTFNSFLAASAPARLSKITNPTSWKEERTALHLSPLTSAPQVQHVPSMSKTLGLTPAIPQTQ